MEDYRNKDWNRITREEPRDNFYLRIGGITGEKHGWQLALPERKAGEFYGRETGEKRQETMTPPWLTSKWNQEAQGWTMIPQSQYLKDYRDKEIKRVQERVNKDPNYDPARDLYLIDYNYQDRMRGVQDMTSQYIAAKNYKNSLQPERFSPIEPWQNTGYGQFSPQPVQQAPTGPIQPMMPTQQAPIPPVQTLPPASNLPITASNAEGYYNYLRNKSGRTAQENAHLITLKSPVTMYQSGLGDLNIGSGSLSTAISDYNLQ